MRILVLASAAALLASTPALAVEYLPQGDYNCTFDEGGASVGTLTIDGATYLAPGASKSYPYEYTQVTAYVDFQGPFGSLTDQGYQIRSTETTGDASEISLVLSHIPGPDVWVICRR